VLLGCQSGHAIQPSFRGEDQPDSEGSERNDDGGCIALVVCLAGYRTKGNLSNATRSATHKAAAAWETTVENDVEGLMRKAVHCVASMCTPGLLASRPGVSPGGNGGGVADGV